jgi:hypothetical protein
MYKFISKCIFSFVLILTISSENIKSQNTTNWGKQFGSEMEEYVMNHLIDPYGNVFIAGKTTGSMFGKNLGKNDGFLTKIDNMGNIVWTRQFGTSGEEDIQWSALDNNGNIYITGSTTGLLNEKYYGKEDIFVIKYTPGGEIEWTRQFGTDSLDIAKGICTDKKGFIYLTGVTTGKLAQSAFGKTDFFLMKLDSKGNIILASQYGTQENDLGYAINGGNDSDVFICGTTWGDLKGKNKGFIDGFTGHFSDNLNLIQYTQFGTDGFDIAMILNIDEENNIYVGGSTSGTFGAQQIGEGDAYLLKINDKGDILWNRQFGTPLNDGIRGIDINPKFPDNILISGIMNLPPGQGFIRMYKKDGELSWEKNFTSVGKNGGTSGKTVLSDVKGNIYHVGLTGADMFGTSYGDKDIYIIKLR